MLIGRIVQQALSAINPLSYVTVHSYSSQSISASGKYTPTYTTTNLTCRIQPISDKLMQSSNIEIGKTYKSFYFLGTSIKTLSRPMSSAGDYIQFGSEYYRITQVPEDFGTGWQHVIGCKGSKLGG